MPEQDNTPEAEAETIRAAMSILGRRRTPAKEAAWEQTRLKSPAIVKGFTPPPRAVKCACGNCLTCKNREYQRNWRQKKKSGK